MLRTSIAAVLLFLASSAGFVSLMSTVMAIGGPQRVFAIHAVLMVAVSIALTWVGAKLWNKWRAALGTCLILGATMAFQLARQVPPEHETGTVSRNYYIVTALLVAAGAALIAWHQRVFSKL